MREGLAWGGSSGEGDVHVIISVLCIALGAKLDEGVTAWAKRGRVELVVFGGLESGARSWFGRMEKWTLNDSTRLGTTATRLRTTPARVGGRQLRLGPRPRLDGSMGYEDDGRGTSRRDWAVTSGGREGTARESSGRREDTYGLELWGLRGAGTSQRMRGPNLEGGNEVSGGRGLGRGEGRTVRTHRQGPLRELRDGSR